MDVVLVIPVRARPQHRREARAHRMQHGLAHVARHVAVGQRNRPAVGELDAANVERVGAAVFGQMGAGDAVAAAAVERIEIVEIADVRCRGLPPAAPCRCGPSRRSRDAIVQRRVAAGFSATRCLSGSTTASSRTRSSPPQPPGPWMSGMLGAIAISSVSASRQAEGGGGAAGCSRSAGCSDAIAGASAGRGFGPASPFRRRPVRHGGLLGSIAGASAGRGFGSGTVHEVRPARLAGSLLEPAAPERQRPGGGPARGSRRVIGRADHQQQGHAGNHLPFRRRRTCHKAISGVLSPR